MNAGRKGHKATSSRVRQGLPRGTWLLLLFIFLPSLVFGADPTSKRRTNYALEFVQGPEGVGSCWVRDQASRNLQAPHGASQTLHTGALEVVCDAIRRAQQVNGCRKVPERSVALCNRAIVESRQIDTRDTRPSNVVEIVSPQDVIAIAGENKLRYRVPSPMLEDQLKWMKGSENSALARPVQARAHHTLVYPVTVSSDDNPGCPNPNASMSTNMRVLLDAKTDELCSGVVIDGVGGPKYLMTAAHCVKGREIIVRTSDRLPKPVTCKYHAEFDKPDNERWDLAVCKLPSSATSGEKIIDAQVLLAEDSEPVSIAGFGLGPNPENSFKPLSGKFCAGTSSVKGLRTPSDQVVKAFASVKGDVYGRGGDSGGGVFWPVSNTSSERRLLGVIIKASPLMNLPMPTPFLDLRSKRFCEFLKKEELRTSTC